jgi:hypothetical protein
VEDVVSKKTKEEEAADAAKLAAEAKLPKDMPEELKSYAVTGKPPPEPKDLKKPPAAATGAPETTPDGEPIGEPTKRADGTLVSPTGIELPPPAHVKHPKIEDVKFTGTGDDRLAFVPEVKANDEDQPGNGSDEWTEEKTEVDAKGKKHKVTLEHRHPNAGLNVPAPRFPQTPPEVTRHELRVQAGLVDPDQHDRDHNTAPPPYRKAKTDKGNPSPELDNEVAHPLHRANQGKRGELKEDANREIRAFAEGYEIEPKEPPLNGQTTGDVPGEGARHCPERPLKERQCKTCNIKIDGPFCPQCRTDGF